jgi:hypothetical protein
VARNAEAADAVLAFCEAAGARLAEVDVPRRKGHSFVYDWTRQGDVFVRRERTEVHIGISVRDELHRLPEFAAAVAAIRADSQMGKQVGPWVGSTMGKQLGPWVGSALGSTKFSAEDILDQILRAGILDDDPIRVDQGAARQAYEERESALYADKVRFTFVAPLLGLEAQELPIELAEGVEIDALRDREIEHCLSAGLPQHGDSSMVFVEQLVGLRVPYEVPKMILPEHEAFADEISEQAGAIFQEFTAHLERITQALRLLKKGAVGSPAYVYFTDDPFHPGTTSQGVGFSSARHYANYALASTENAQVRELWAMLSADEVAKHKTLPSALRRFGQARDRDRPENELIDLMIAAETLFLPGEEQGDPSYKLALRSAFFLADLGRPPAQTFGQMKRAYTASRSAVHSSQLGTLELGDGRRVELNEFVAETSELVREALAKAVRVATDTGGDALLDFDSPILGE